MRGNEAHEQCGTDHSPVVARQNPRTESLKALLVRLRAVDPRRALAVTGLAGVLGAAALGGVVAGADAPEPDHSAATAVALRAAVSRESRDSRAGAEKAATRSFDRIERMAAEIAASAPKGAVAPAAKPKAVAKPKTVRKPKTVTKPKAVAKPRTVAEPKAVAKPKSVAKPKPKAVVLTPVAGLDLVQMRNAQAIVQAAKAMDLPERAMVLAVACSMQESNLYNLASTVLPESYRYTNEGQGSDHDSVGLFQQRPSSGWGAVRDLMQPKYAATQFYKALVNVYGWQNMALTDAVQAVQISGFPYAYAKHEWRAQQVVDALNR